MDSRPPQWFFGRYLQRLIERKGGKEAGFTQEYLAEASGVSQSTINWYLQGYMSGKKGHPSPQLDTILALARALRVPPEHLLKAYQGIDPDEAKAPDAFMTEEEAERALEFLSKFIKERKDKK